jgi:hypothetical protein
MASRDFLGGFGREGGAPAAGGGSAATADSDDVELSLGLSLGGCFGGADPAHDAKKPRLVRSTSIPSICSLPGGFPSGDGEEPAAVTAPPSDLLRTSSLPAEYMEDRLRRRAMQSQRRLEAKRKRLERRNSMNSGKLGTNAATASCRDEALLEQTVPSGFQYRRTVALQGTTSSSVPEHGKLTQRAKISTSVLLRVSSTIIRSISVSWLLLLDDACTDFVLLDVLVSLGTRCLMFDV